MTDASSSPEASATATAELVVAAFLLALALAALYALSGALRWPGAAVGRVGRDPRRAPRRPRAARSRRVAGVGDGAERDVDAPTGVVPGTRDRDLRPAGVERLDLRDLEVEVAGGHRPAVVGAGGGRRRLGRTGGGGGGRRRPVDREARRRRGRHDAAGELQELRAALERATSEEIRQLAVRYHDRRILRATETVEEMRAAAMAAGPRGG